MPTNPGAPLMLRIGMLEDKLQALTITVDAILAKQKAVPFSAAAGAQQPKPTGATEKKGGKNA